MKQTLWTKNFTLVTVATTLGAMGGVAGSFALSFLMFDETGSTLDRKRAGAGFLGVNSATMRQAAVQRYLPEGLRARVNAFESMCIMAASCVCSLGMGVLGEVLDYRLCMSLGAAFTLVMCWQTIWKNRGSVRGIYQCHRSKK